MGRGAPTTRKIAAGMHLTRLSMDDKGPSKRTLSPQTRERNRARARKYYERHRDEVLARLKARYEAKCARQRAERRRRKHLHLQTKWRRHPPIDRMCLAFLLN
ncbi:hypothetical protein SDRG_09695 [Saprolegnia diclina VS20]|uniref:BZIP domain-containing protein n=1 Tax=Saprolegnia diclina (strain VS20) TaxID=1156394 RepID=T0Q4G2_SAPDV|nr:hypothetical protein SDRG_09695 [Saprolegnia diclina VS20]EQC32724.1 hypothetical protein SDRG_09695 [Saprolegnia diclina VS20]|eukprot:XP_008613868.1 hypothetical protein SDRG_09695 [Saprolegnia diclina VS20]